MEPRTIRRGLLGMAAVVVLAGCGAAEEAAETPAPAPATQAQPPSPRAEAGAVSTSPSPTAGTVGIADPGRGSGTIRGALDSPYARIGTGVVFIENVEGIEFEPPSDNSMMDQKNIIFTPHVLPVMVGSTVDFPNTDDVRHSVYSREGSSSDFNLGQYDAGVVKSVTFETVGVTHLACNVHAEMSGYIITGQNPFFAVTDNRGGFVIEGVPAGTYNLTFWHEALASATMTVTVEPGQDVNVEFTGLTRK